MNAYRNASFVGFVLMLFGLVIVGYGAYHLKDYWNLEENAVRTTGTVIEIGNNGPMYKFPIIEFTAQDGKTYRFKRDLELNMDFFDYTIGQTVNVIYDTSNPNNARLDQFWDKHFLHIFLGGFGVFLFLFGWIFRRIMLGKAKRYDERANRR